MKTKTKQSLEVKKKVESSNIFKQSKEYSYFELTVNMLQKLTFMQRDILYLDGEVTKSTSNDTFNDLKFHLGAFIFNLYLLQNKGIKMDHYEEDLSKRGSEAFNLTLDLIETVTRLQCRSKDSNLFFSSGLIQDDTLIIMTDLINSLKSLLAVYELDMYECLANYIDRVG